MDHKINPRRVASIMCDVTIDMLWVPRLQWARSKSPGCDLKARVGSGRATYVRHPAVMNSDPLKPFVMKLTYGEKMVESKCSTRQALAWLSSREIMARGYFNKELTLLNILAHTCLHEFSHVCQVLLKRRYDGSVHNEEFYKILDSAHFKGYGFKVRDELHRRCLNEGIDLSAIRHNPNEVKQDGFGMEDVHVGQLYTLQKAPYPYSEYNPYEVIKKHRTFVHVRSKANPDMQLKARPMMLKPFH